MKRLAGPRVLPARRVLALWSQMQVVVISPFEAERAALDALLRGEGHLVTSAATPVDGLALARTQRPDVIVADAQVPGLHGAELLRALARPGSSPRVILLCARANRVLADRGVVCLTKPIHVAELQRHVAGAAAPALLAGAGAA